MLEGHLDLPFFDDFVLSFVVCVIVMTRKHVNSECSDFERKDIQRTRRHSINEPACPTDENILDVIVTSRKH